MHLCDAAGKPGGRPDLSPHTPCKSGTLVYPVWRMLAERAGTHPDMHGLVFTPSWPHALPGTLYPSMQVSLQNAAHLSLIFPTSVCVQYPNHGNQGPDRYKYVFTYLCINKGRMRQRH